MPLQRQAFSVKDTFGRKKVYSSHLRGRTIGVYQ